MSRNVQQPKHCDALRWIRRHAIGDALSKDDSNALSHETMSYLRLETPTHVAELLKHLVLPYFEGFPMSVSGRYSQPGTSSGLMFDLDPARVPDENNVNQHEYRTCLHEILDVLNSALQRDGGDSTPQMYKLWKQDGFWTSRVRTCRDYVWPPTADTYNKWYYDPAAVNATDDEIEEGLMNDSSVQFPWRCDPAGTSTDEIPNSASRQARSAYSRRFMALITESGKLVNIGNSTTRRVFSYHIHYPFLRVNYGERKALVEIVQDKLADALSRSLLKLDVAPTTIATLRVPLCVGMDGFTVRPAGTAHFPRLIYDGRRLEDTTDNDGLASVLFPGVMDHGAVTMAMRQSCAFLAACTSWAPEVPAVRDPDVAMVQVVHRPDEPLADLPTVQQRLRILSDAMIETDSVLKGGNVVAYEAACMRYRQTAKRFFADQVGVNFELTMLATYVNVEVARLVSKAIESAAALDPASDARDDIELMTRLGTAVVVSAYGLFVMGIECERSKNCYLFRQAERRIYSDSWKPTFQMEERRRVVDLLAGINNVTVVPARVSGEGKNKKTVKAIMLKNTFDIWNSSACRVSCKRVTTGPVLQPEDFSIATGNDLSIEESDAHSNFECIGKRTGRVMNAALVESLIYHYWCRENPVVYEFLMNWFAAVIQRPFSQLCSAVILRSDPGALKSVICSTLCEAIGQNAHIESMCTRVTSKFNSVIANPSLIVVEEFQKIAAEDMQTLKSLVTDSCKTVERKGVDAVSAVNYTNLIMNTNDKVPKMPLDLKDRRFFFVDIDPLLSLAHDLMSDVAEFLREKRDGGQTTLASGGMAFISKLYHRNIGSFDGRNPPCTPLRCSVIVAGLDLVTAYCLEFMSTEGFANQSVLRDPFTDRQSRTNWMTDQMPRAEVQSDLLYGNFVEWRQRRDGGRSQHGQSVMHSDFITRFAALLGAEPQAPGRYKLRLQSYASSYLSLDATFSDFHVAGRDIVDQAKKDVFSNYRMPSLTLRDAPDDGMMSSLSQTGTDEVFFNNGEPETRYVANNGHSLTRCMVTDSRLRVRRHDDDEQAEPRSVGPAPPLRPAVSPRQYDGVFVMADAPVLAPGASHRTTSTFVPAPDAFVYPGDDATERERRKRHEELDRVMARSMRLEEEGEAALRTGQTVRRPLQSEAPDRTEYRPMQGSPALRLAVATSCAARALDVAPTAYAPSDPNDPHYLSPMDGPGFDIPYDLPVDSNGSPMYEDDPDYGDSDAMDLDSENTAPLPSK